MSDLHWFPDILKPEKNHSKYEDEDSEDYNSESSGNKLLDFVKLAKEQDCNFKYVSKYNKLDDSNRFPISQRKALKIAEADKNLKNDFCKKDRRNITYLSFNDFYVDLVERSNNQYWLVQITEGDISWVDGDTCCDGWLDKRDCFKLQCLVDVNTGEYKYYNLL